MNSEGKLGGPVMRIAVRRSACENRQAGKWLPLICFPLMLAATPSHAALIFDGVATGKGAGIGTSNVVLTIQNTPTEQGCVGWNGTTSVVGSTACQGGLTPAITGGNEKTGASQTQTQTVSSAGVLSGESLVVILNVSEPGGTLFTVEDLSLSIFSPTGTVLFNSGNLTGAGVPPGGGISVNSSFQGQGNLGFAFTLDASEAAAADPFLCTSGLVSGCAGVFNVANANNRIGLSAILTNTQGGNETFSVADFSVVTVPPTTPVPEPFTMGMFGAGLGCIAFLRRRLKKT